MFENVRAILVVLKVLQEGRLTSREFGELDTNLAVVDLKDADTNINIVLDIVLEIVSSSQGVLDLVFILLGLDVEVLVLQVVDEGLLNHVGVVS